MSVLVSLHWIPTEHRMRYKTAVLSLNCVYGVTPTYLQNLTELYIKEKLKDVPMIILLCLYWM